MGDFMEHLGRSDVLGVDAQSHEYTEQLMNLLHYAEASVFLKFDILQLNCDKTGNSASHEHTSMRGVIVSTTVQTVSRKGIWAVAATSCRACATTAVY